MNTAGRPKILGIVNITNDSFSDGGRFLDPKAAIAHARKLLEDGADALDVGAAASNPGAESVPAQEEIRRLRPLLDAGFDRDRLSIDTFSPETQLWCLDQNVGWLNDIQGFPERSIYPRLAASAARLIVMHNITRRGAAQFVETDPRRIFDILFEFFDHRVAALTAAGVSRDRIVLDPGMGYFLGTDPEVSLTVLRQLPKLKQRYNLPLMISVSRKSFVRRLANVDVANAGAATLAAELFAASKGADMLRTHDPRGIRQALQVWSALDAG